MMILRTFIGAAIGLIFWAGVLISLTTAYKYAAQFLSCT